MLRGLIALLCTRAAFSAFTLPISELRGSLEQNSKGTWCWYPGYMKVDLTCRGAFASYNAVLEAHINQTISIGYYNVNLERLGGPEWRIPSSYVGVIYVCLSGKKVGTEVFNTLCGRAYEDNRLPSEGCEVALAQTTVTDGCYDPSSPAPTSPQPASSTSRNTSQAPGNVLMSNVTLLVIATIFSIISITTTGLHAGYM